MSLRARVPRTLGAFVFGAWASGCWPAHRTKIYERERVTSTTHQREVLATNLPYALRSPDGKVELRASTQVRSWDEQTIKTSVIQERHRSPLILKKSRVLRVK